MNILNNETLLAIKEEYGVDAAYAFEKKILNDYIKETMVFLDQKKITPAEATKSIQYANEQLQKLRAVVGYNRYINLKPFEEYTR